MKKIYLLLTTFIISVSAYAQWSGSTDIYNTANGKVGINNSSPQARLHINAGSGTIALGEVNATSQPNLGWANSYLGFNLYNSSAGNWTLNTDSNHNGGTGIYSDPFGNLTFLSIPNGTTGTSSQVLTDATLKNNIRLLLNPYNLATRVKLNVNEGYKRATINALPIGMRDPHNYANSYIGFNVEDDGVNWWMNGDGGHDGGGMILGTAFGDLRFYTVPSENASGHAVSNAQMVNNLALRINASSIYAARPVQIGSTAIPSGYSLSADGKVICDEVTVKLHTTWPDYVFDKQYKLPSLRYVNEFIHENGHLPEMPSAEEVSRNGLDVGAMNAALLKKVEELTLYVIQLEKVNDEQSKLLNAVAEKLNIQK